MAAFRHKCLLNYFALTGSFSFWLISIEMEERSKVIFPAPVSMITELFFR